MADHVHWMSELRAAHLPDIARRMKSSSALALNGLAARRCTVWQPGYFDQAVRAGESLARQALYILGNPVHAGLAGQIGEYPYAWSAWL
jgi:REP element-mobilizing transposase RayT